MMMVMVVMVIKKLDWQGFDLGTFAAETTGLPLHHLGYGCDGDCG